MMQSNQQKKIKYTDDIFLTFKDYHIFQKLSKNLIKTVRWALTVFLII